MSRYSWSGWQSWLSIITYCLLQRQQVFATRIGIDFRTASAQLFVMVCWDRS